LYSEAPASEPTHFLKLYNNKLTKLKKGIYFLKIKDGNIFLAKKRSIYFRDGHILFLRFYLCQKIQKLFFYPKIISGNNRQIDFHIFK
jgi:hypothetical protein